MDTIITELTEQICSSSNDKTLTDSSEQFYEKTSQQQLINTNVVQNFLLIWFNSTIIERDNNYQNLITHLRSIVNNIHLFKDADQCVDFLTDIDYKKVLLIITGDLDQSIVPLIHDTPQLDSIYLFSQTKTTDKQWTKE
jgi:hypothetical protein